MGIIVIIICTSIALTFLAGIIFATIHDSDNEEHPFCGILTILWIIISIVLTIGVTHEYTENKEYSLTKYNLKKKVITTEEDNTVQLDTIYTFTHR